MKFSQRDLTRLNAWLRTLLSEYVQDNEEVKNTLAEYIQVILEEFDSFPEIRRKISQDASDFLKQNTDAFVDRVLKELPNFRNLANDDNLPEEGEIAHGDFGTHNQSLDDDEEEDDRDYDRKRHRFEDTDPYEEEEEVYYDAAPFTADNYIEESVEQDTQNEAKEEQRAEEKDNHPSSQTKTQPARIQAQERSRAFRQERDSSRNTRTSERPMSRYPKENHPQRMHPMHGQDMRSSSYPTPNMLNPVLPMPNPFALQMNARMVAPMMPMQGITDKGYDPERPMMHGDGMQGGFHRVPGPMIAPGPLNQQLFLQQAAQMMRMPFSSMHPPSQHTREVSNPGLLSTPGAYQNPPNYSSMSSHPQQQQQHQQQRHTFAHASHLGQQTDQSRRSTTNSTHQYNTSSSQGQSQQKYQGSQVPQSNHNQMYRDKQQLMQSQKQASQTQHQERSGLNSEQEASSEVSYTAVQGTHTTPARYQTDRPLQRPRPNLSQTKLCVYNLPEEYNDIVKLSQYFGKFGSIITIQTNIPRQKAFIQYATHSEAKQCMDSTEPIFENRRISVSWAYKDPREAENPTRPNARQQTSTQFRSSSLPAQKQEMEEPAVISYNPKQKAELGEIDVKIAKQEASINTIMSNEKIPLANREALVSKIRLGIEQLQTRRDEIRKQARAISIAIARKQKLEGSSSSNQVEGANSAALASGTTPTKTISQDTVLTPKQSSRAIGRGKPVERPVMKLDNRPKSLVITNAPDEFKDTTVLFNYFKKFGLMTAYSYKNGCAYVTYQLRAYAEKAMRFGARGRFGYLQMDWYAPPQKQEASKTTAKHMQSASVQEKNGSGSASTENPKPETKNTTQSAELQKSPVDQNATGEVAKGGLEEQNDEAGLEDEGYHEGDDADGFEGGEHQDTNDHDGDFDGENNDGGDESVEYFGQEGQDDADGFADDVEYFGEELDDQEHEVHDETKQ
eukprot:TRINITY_DN3226_c0_g1_i3.p1 TRINITY_DN3226_c0_g1~~TRINITY_DN3226_c0_g1_i3.p1  ORF type:complete len:958 (+),score=228.95 TRINITY_DN3226_c0_g1_i3:57-2930(+)